ncbi:MAG: hypothetical protein JSR46_05660 [Verrucomicrobia bacterium]|nr:hypothetical protein [Verrucomicrobiota bacterium]
MKQCFFCLILSAAFVISCKPPQPTVDATSSREEATPLVVLQKKNPDSVYFGTERLSDIGIESVGDVASFQLVVRNAPPDQKYMLSNRNLGGPIKPIYEYQADDDGTLGRQVSEGTMMLDNDVWLMFDFFRGEPVEYFLTSRDGATELVTTFVPYPIKATGKDGAEISVRRLVPDARLMLCEGDGFVPDEEVLVSSQSANERTVDVPYICRNGRFSMLLEPQAAGKSGGVAYIEVKRAAERLALEYDWGCQALNPKRRVANSSKMKQDALSKLPVDLD